MTLLTLLLWISKITTILAQISCHDAFECALTVIFADNTTSSGDGDIECYGYHSCSECDLIETTNDDATLKCFGSFSCYNATLITSSYDTQCMRI